MNKTERPDNNPKIIKGKVKNTGYPIDGHVMIFSQWKYDGTKNWHLYSWEQADDEAVMETMYLTEVEQGFCAEGTYDEFVETWKAGEYESPGVFILDLDEVDVLEEIQTGTSIKPRQENDQGGVLCLPLDKNLNGDTKANHPDWELIYCPKCGQKCWKMPEADRLQEQQGVSFMCTECAVEAGLLTPYPGQAQTGNMAQRRRAKRESKKK